MASGSHAENELMDVRKMLLRLPSSRSELLGVLRHIMIKLSLLDQNPSESLKHAMHPIAEALIANELVRHHDMDVKILVLCCNCEILRIMAPHPPYNDEQLKDFFELATMMFQKLSFASCEHYWLTEAIMTFRKFQLQVVMLDLQQHSLVVQLFKQFLILANSSTPELVLEMEMIMTSIIEECDEPETMPELVRLLLMSVREDSRAKLAMFASPVCQELGEKVVNKCAGLLKPYLPDIIRKMGIPLHDYSEIVVHICNEAMVPPEIQDDVSKKRKLECTEGNSNTVQTLRHCHEAEDENTTFLIANDPIICVQGYKVKKSIVPILEAIFMKHGDIATACMFKAECVRASFLELVCEVVTQLQTNDDENIISMMEEIESKVSEAEVANVNVSWLRSHLEATRKTSLFMETNAKTSMVKKAAEMEVRERHAELIDAQHRFEKAERCMKVLDLVEKKLNSNIWDSKKEAMTTYIGL